MYMKCKNLSRFIPAFLIFFFCFAIDYRFMGDIFRLGKQRILFVLAPMFIPFIFREQFIPALLLSYGLAFWANYNFHIYSVMDLASFGICLCVAQFLLRFSKELIAKYFVYFGAVQAAYGTLQVMGVQLLYDVPEPFFQGKPLALMGQHTVLGAFLVACLAPALWLQMPISASFIFVCALLTGSSTTYASLWVLLSLFAWYKERIKLCIIMQFTIISTTVIAWLVNPKLEVFNLQQRPRLWAEGIKAFKQNSIFGGGPGFWAGEWQPANMPKIDGFVPSLLHSDWLTLFVEYGLIGVLICSVGLFFFLRNFKLTWHHAVCVVILVNGLANFPLHIVPIGVLFLLCLGYSMNTNFNKEYLWKH